MPSTAQRDLFGAPANLPPGFAYRPALIGVEDERALATAMEPLPFAPYEMHGHQANRQVVAFGARYDHVRRQVTPAPPIPQFLLPLRARAAAAFGRPAEAFVQVLINQYREGAGIGWHRDRAYFDEVIGVSLLAPCRFRLRLKDGADWARRELTLEPRSAYLMSGEARTDWEHSVTPLDRLRYSITFRSVA